MTNALLQPQIDKIIAAELRLKELRTMYEEGLIAGEEYITKASEVIEPIVWAVCTTQDWVEKYGREHW